MKVIFNLRNFKNLDQTGLLTDNFHSKLSSSSKVQMENSDRDLNQEI